jgi:hypothetical protein
MNLNKIIFIMRHGHRSPVFLYNEESTWKKRKELTEKGAEACFKTGQSFRTRYCSFLETGYTTNIISTNVSRTKDSAYYLLHGIKNLKLILEENKDAKLSFLKAHNIYIIPPLRDLIQKQDGPQPCPSCARYFHISNQEFQEKRFGYNHFEKYLSFLKQRCPFESDSPFYMNLFFIYDFLLCYVDHGFPLPQGFSTQMFNDLKFAKNLVFYDCFLANKQMRRIKNHFLYKSVLEKLEEKDDGKKIIIYLNHDVNIWAFVLGLKYELTESPTYCAHITLEIHEKIENKNEKFVRIFYQDERIDEEISKAHGFVENEDCSKGIPFDRFIQILKSEMFKDLNEFVENCYNLKLENEITEEKLI